jgi:hypothetical protein
MSADLVHFVDFVVLGSYDSSSATDVDLRRRAAMNAAAPPSAASGPHLASLPDESVRAAPVLGRVATPPAAPGLASAVAVGRSTALTMTVKSHVTSLPLASVAVQVTLLDPAGKPEPLAGSQANPTLGQLSLAAGSAKSTMAELSPGAASTTMSGGQVMVGACPSSTITVNVHVAVFSAPSVAAHVAVVVPTG